MKIALFLALAITATLTMVTPVLAASPDDGPARSHPEFEKVVFVHYAENFVKKGNGITRAPQLYSYSGYHWKIGTVPYEINLVGSPIADADAINGIRASFQTWQDDPGSEIVFDYQGTTSTFPGLTAASPDYRNVVGWGYLSARYPGAIAVTITWATRGNKVIVDSDTVLNTDSLFSWTQDYTNTDPNSFILDQTPAYDVDVQNVMTHEAGHWLQLNDLSGSAAAEQTMFGVSSDGELKKRSLESGDLAGVQRIY
jgi:hypothetical protein